MAVIAWIVLGLVAGFIGSKIVHHRGEGAVLDIVLGILGALAGGAMFHMLGLTGMTGVNIYSLLVAVLGSVALLTGYHLLISSDAMSVR